jgi:hypothetical protein
MRKVVTIIQNVNMGCGHNGLIKVAREFGYDPRNCEQNDLIYFVNRAKDKIKAIGSEGTVVGYYRGTKKLELSDYDNITQCFGGGIVSFGNTQNTNKLRKSLLGGTDLRGTHAIFGARKLKIADSLTL